MSFSLSQASFDDLREDYEILTYLYTDCIEKLDFLLNKIKKTEVSKFPETRTKIAQEIERLKKTYIEFSKDFTVRSDDLYKEIARKNYYQEYLRTFQGVIASLITSFDFQSPSFLHSLMPEAGIQLGRIVGNENDYKRDVNLDALRLENRYLKQYIDCPLPYKLFVKVLATSSGMSAFTTILHFLIGEDVLSKKVLMGASTYFQAKIIASQLLNNSIVEVDELNTIDVISKIKIHKPNVIFLDSLANSRYIPSPDIKTIFNYLTDSHKDPITVVFDNTGLSVFCQVLPLLASKRNRITLLSYESLNKYLQFGMDRVTGGMITAYGKNIGRLLPIREHLGTNISDSTAWAIPTPNRRLLEKRMIRIDRNTHLLAQALSSVISSKTNSYFDSVVYPGLDNHKSFTWISPTFRGGYFTIKVKRKNDNQKFYKSFQRKVIEAAAKEKINIVGGSSFGLNTTRVYITALTSEFGDPFIRISPGTESIEEIEKIKTVLLHAVTT